METFIIIISIMVGALIGALITALVLQNKNGKVAAQVSVLASQLKTEEEKAASLIQEKERNFQRTLDEKERSFQNALDEKERVHRDALQAQQRQFEETMEKVSAQMKVATDEMLKQRQKEFADASNQNLGQIVNPLRETIRTFDSILKSHYTAHVDGRWEIKYCDRR